MLRKRAQSTTRMDVQTRCDLLNQGMCGSRVISSSESYDWMEVSEIFGWPSLFLYYSSLISVATSLRSNRATIGGVAPVVQLVTTSKPSDVGTRGRISAQSHEVEFSLTSCPTRGERLYHGYTRFDFTVDEGKGRLNPSRDKKLRQAPQKEGGPRLVRPHINRKV